MGKELYNNKSSIEKILGDLPKIGAPDNFELNLMTKIKNENFGNSLNEPTAKSKFSWIFAPAAVVAVSVVILFFVFDFQTAEPENLLMLDPETRAELTSGLEKNRDRALSNPGVSDYAEKEVGKSERSISEKKAKENVKGGIGGNISGGGITSAKPYKKVLPYNDKDAIDLDNYLTEGSRSNAANNRALIVGGGNYNSGFDGFMVQKNDVQLLEALKAKMDSLYYALKDSLNNSAPNN
ncbi:MAG: hypothetical protein HND52_03030 [Ignavibacteriae bacterium]|nr:hypothetical protein [Ignavibacteriota bacterium]NOG96926.1 hypothetical protein [Ignavibacteriota bacterium]